MHQGGEQPGPDPLPRGRRERFAVGHRRSVFALGAAHGTRVVLFPVGSRAPGKPLLTWRVATQEETAAQPGALAGRARRTDADGPGTVVIVFAPEVARANESSRTTQK